MKKILYIVSNPFNFSRQSVGGNISSASGVINGFRSKGYYVDIVTDSKIPTLESNSDDLTTIFYPYHFIRSRIPYKLKGFIGRVFNKIDHTFFQFAMKTKISELIKVNDYDFCYMRVSYNGHAAASVINKAKLNLIVEVNKPLSMGPYNAKDNLKWPKNGEKVRVPESEIIQYDTAHLITVDSSVRARWITEFVGKKYQEKMLINPNGVNTEMFSPLASPNQFLDELEISNDDIVVGMASSFRWYNDIDELCKILNKVVLKIPNIKSLIIVGNKEKEIELRKKISKYGLESSSIILCQIPFNEMPAYLNRCDILLSHFNFHGKWPHNCSIKHLEYLSLGKPTVATDVGEVNFAIEHEVNGILCAEGDVEGFSNSIIRLANDSGLRKKLGSHGREKALQDLTWEANVDKILNFFNNMYRNTS